MSFLSTMLLVTSLAVTTTCIDIELDSQAVINLEWFPLTIGFFFHDSYLKNDDTSLHTVVFIENYIIFRCEIQPYITNDNVYGIHTSDNNSPMQGKLFDTTPFSLEKKDDMICIRTLKYPEHNSAFSKAKFAFENEEQANLYIYGDLFHNLYAEYYVTTSTKVSLKSILVATGELYVYCNQLTKFIVCEVEMASDETASIPLGASIFRYVEDEEPALIGIVNDVNESQPK